MPKGIILYCLMIISLKSFSQSYDLAILDINTSARLYGFGEVGVVSSPFYKNTGVYQNPALISNYSRSAGINFTYEPWLRKLSDNMNLYSFDGFYSIDSLNALGFCLSYFDLGTIIVMDEFGEYIGEDKPSELYFKMGYTNSFNKFISGGVALKYFKSDIAPAGATFANDVNSFALDLGFSYKKVYSLNSISFLHTNAGLAITNLGPKVEYTDNNKSFIPTKLLLGAFINPDIGINDKYRISIELGYQMEKLLVPSDENSDLSSFEALYVSFTDAPGGFEEELDEIRHKFGSELRLSIFDYGYVAFRHGRSVESELKGNRNYQTFGYGMGAFGFMLDFMHIVADSDSPLNKTWAFSFGFQANLDKELFKF